MLYGRFRGRFEGSYLSRKRPDFLLMNKSILRGILFLYVWMNCFVLEAKQAEKVMTSKTDSLPAVFGGDNIDLIEKDFRQKAVLHYRKHQLPQNKVGWTDYKKTLTGKILEKSGAVINHELALNYKETRTHQLQGYSVKNIIFQTRPGIYATANLYVPKGKGSFPAVIAMHGHWPNGKSNEVVQSLGHTLALNGYVCLVIDAWGSGERTTVHGVHEYHGSNLGASIMNLGETLMGVQISDNIRGVDLLSSLPYVDKNQIGATGASGGGNQTMWLSALDERVKACMPVVSVGTFEAYIMRSNCVCELLPEGLTFTEEAGVLAMIAPRALKMASALHDTNPAFIPAEMLRSYENALQVFDMLGALDKISYQLFNTGHGYWPEMRETMLGYFDLHLKNKGTGAAKKEIPFELLAEKDLMVYQVGKRDTSVESIADYSRKRGSELRNLALKTVSADAEKKRSELRQLVKISEDAALINTHTYEVSNDWQRIALETSTHHLIPVLLKKPAAGKNKYVIVLNPQGKKMMSPDELERFASEGKGILVMDLWGTGESQSAATLAYEKSLPPFHTLARASLWLGETVMGKWVQEINIAVGFVKTQSPETDITLLADKEAGIAALLYAALYKGKEAIVVRGSLVSYQFNKRESVDFFNMALHVPGILKWGDISLVSALAQTSVVFEKPVTMSGETIAAQKLEEIKSEFEKVRKNYGQSGSVTFK